MPAVNAMLCLRLFPGLRVRVSAFGCDNIPKIRKFLRELSSFFWEQLAMSMAKSSDKIILNIIFFSCLLKSKKIEPINFIEVSKKIGSFVLLLNGWIFI